MLYRGQIIRFFLCRPTPNPLQLLGLLKTFFLESQTQERSGLALFNGCLCCFFFWFATICYSRGLYTFEILFFLRSFTVFMPCLETFVCVSQNVCSFCWKDTHCVSPRISISPFPHTGASGAGRCFGPPFSNRAQRRAKPLAFHPGRVTSVFFAFTLPTLLRMVSTHAGHDGGHAKDPLASPRCSYLFSQCLFFPFLV